MIKAGLIGLGGIAETHLRECRELKEEVAIQAAAEIDEGRLRLVADQWQIKERYTDPKKMLKEAGLDAVIICMPPVGRAELIRTALENNTAVFCEKPMAATLEEAKEIAEICRQYPDIPVVINFKMRQGQNFQRVKEALEREEVGEPITMVCRYALVTDPDIWAPPRWFWNMDISGGLLIENGGHMIDYLLWTGGRVKGLYAYLEQKTISERPEEYMRRTKTEDHAVLLMKHENGCLTTFINTICYPGNRDASIEIATRGGYFIEVSECRALRIRKGEKIVFESSEEEYGIGDGYTMRHFIKEVLKQKKPAFVTWKEGYAALEIAVRARESARLGKWVEVKGEP